MLSLLLAFMFGFFLDEHWADATSIKGDGLDPFTFDKVVVLVIIICGWETDHVVDWDHVSMGNEHVHFKVQDLSVHVKELCNSLMDHPFPFILVTFLYARLKADFIAPGMTNLSNLRDQFFHFGVLIHFLVTILF